jgi:hypothetical protein
MRRVWYVSEWREIRSSLTRAVLTRKIGWFKDSFSTPPLTRLHFSVMIPAISIAPQKLSSRSPCEKCKSPMERFAPGI